VEFLSDLPALVPSVGVLGLLAWLLIHVMRQASGDRGGYNSAVSALREQHATEIREMTARHDAQIADLRQQVTALRGEVHDLRVRLEDERQSRWAAEDAVARYRRLTGRDVDEPAP